MPRFQDRPLFTFNRETIAHGGQTYSQRTYYRDDRDRITAFRKSNNPGANPMENGHGDRFRYDEEGQLVEAWYNAADPVNSGAGNNRYDGFNYDQLGNRAGANFLANRGPMTFTRKDNGLNQYHTWGSNPASYDDDIGNGWGALGAANGVLMQDGNVTAGFNALNQPIMINTASMGGDWMFFGYDPLGRCVKRWTGALVTNNPFPGIPAPWSNPATYYYYDGSSLIQEGPSASAISQVYMLGNHLDDIVADYAVTNNQWMYHHADGRGHCVLLTDRDGVLAEQYEYDAFGHPHCYSVSNGWSTDLDHSSFSNRFLFTGREYLGDLKLYDYRARMYQPELGRFLQPDPSEFAAGDYNLYRYCHNDPVNKADPTGMAERIQEDFQWKMNCFFDGGNSFQGSWNEFSNRHQPENTSNNVDAAYQPIHVVNEGNGGDRNAADYYQPGPLIGKNGKPNDNQGQTIADHHSDARSHSMMLTESGGNLVEQYEYDAFGQPYFFSASGGSRTSSNYGNRFLFTGREYLSDLKLYDYRARMYQPELGRFLQPDQKEFAAGDYNLYRYCHNDPVNRTDPTGLQDEKPVQRDIMWDMARYADSSNTSQGSFAQFTNRAYMGYPGDMASQAEKRVGSMKYRNTTSFTGNPVYHCNEFPADMATASGRAPPQVWVEPGLGKGGLTGRWRNAYTSELADPNVKIRHWSSPRPVSEARRNDIIAQRHGRDGHTGVVTSPGNSIPVDTRPQYGGQVRADHWGFRPFPDNGEKPGDPPPVVRHYLPGSGGEW